MLRHMQNYLHEKMLPPSYFINVGTIMDKNILWKGRIHHRLHFIFVDDLYPDTGSIRNIYRRVCIFPWLSDNTSLEAEYATDCMRR